MLLKERTNGHNHAAHSRDHNLRSAYIHVLADALTSVLAIIALSAGRLLGWIWLDPLMGIVGAGLIARWAYTLMRDTGRILLDMEINKALSEQIRGLLESNPDNLISDLHVWRVGPGHFAAIVSLITHDPHPPAHYKERLAHIKEISHVTLEINPVSGIEGQIADMA